MSEAASRGSTFLPIGMLILVTAAGVALALALVLATDGYPLDDAWIHLDYARSLTETFTFGHTPGEWENGSTSPLWSVLVAVPLAAGVPPGVAAKLLGLVSLGVLCFLLDRVGTRIGGRVAGVIAAGLVALDPWIGVLAASGMEPVGAMAVAFLAIDALLERRPLRAGLAAAATGLLRPELALLVPCLLASHLLLERDGGRVRPRRNRRIVSLLLPPLLAGGGWMLYGAIVTGLPFPNSFWIKTTSQVGIGRQLDALAALFFAGPLLASVIAAALAAAGSARLARGSPRWTPVLVVAPASVILYYVLRLPLGGDYGPLAPGSAENVYFARYSLVVAPWIALWIAVGCVSLPAFFGKLLAGRAGATRAARGTIAVVFLAAPAILPWQARRPVLREAYRANCAEIERVQIAMARWIDEHLPEDAVVGVSDAGALRFFTDCRIIDLVGLNTHEVLRADDPVGWLGDQGLTHLAVWPHWHRRWSGDPRLETRRILSIPIERPTIVAAPELVLFEARIGR